MPACYIDGVALQPSGGAGVILASADMVQPCEGDILVPIRAVPQERLLNPLGRGANRVAPAVVVQSLYLPTKIFAFKRFCACQIAIQLRPFRVRGGKAFRHAHQPSNRVLQQVAPQPLRARQVDIRIRIIR